MLAIGVFPSLAIPIVTRQDSLPTINAPKPYHVLTLDSLKVLFLKRQYCFSCHSRVSRRRSKAIATERGNPYLARRFTAGYLAVAGTATFQTSRPARLGIALCKAGSPVFCFLIQCSLFDIRFHPPSFVLRPVPGIQNRASSIKHR